MLAACRGAAWCARRLGQPGVVGEMAAGLALGPSLFGAIAPEAFRAVFPTGGLAGLETLGRVALHLFLFIVGLRTDLPSLAPRFRAAAGISVASMAIPFLVALPLGFALYNGYAGPGTTALPFALFFAAAESVTAMPVLARILAERGMIESPVGSLALTCAAFDDLVCWTVLILVSAATKLHPVFLSFGAGLLVPRSWQAARHVAARGEPVVAAAFLPLFFAVTGLKTHAELLDSASAWLVALVVVAVAVVGKGGGSALVARATGYSRNEALSVGALLNTRGLMELVFLNVGRELGLISPQLFAIMVLMALITTAMTGPLLNRFYSPSPAEPAGAQ